MGMRYIIYGETDDYDSRLKVFGYLWLPKKKAWLSPKENPNKTSLEHQLLMIEIVMGNKARIINKVKL